MDMKVPAIRIGTRTKSLLNRKGLACTQKQIKFLNIALDYDDLGDMLDEYNLPTSGKKSNLCELIAKNDSIMLSSFMFWKSISAKDEIEDCCDSLGIKSDGVRKDLETRIEDYLFKKEKHVSNNIESKINDSPFVQCLGTGKPKREFMYVDDLVINSIQNISQLILHAGNMSSDPVTHYNRESLISRYIFF